MDHLGQVIGGRYRLDADLCAGTAGTVYLAEDLLRHHGVALKLAHAPRPAVSSHFHREAVAGRHIVHRNVVSVIDEGIADGLPYLVMELVDGRPLATVLAEERLLPMSRIATIVEQLLGGLEAIHAAGFVHGSVTADNILVDANDRVTVVDLGLAHRSRSPRPNELTGETAMSGDPGSMAPELIRGAPQNVATDLYAAGVIVYELLTGVKPFDGDTHADTLRRHLGEEPVLPSLCCLDRSIPEALDLVVVTSLEKDPHRRFTSARAFAAAFVAAMPHIDAVSPGFSTTTPTLRWTPAVAAFVPREIDVAIEAPDLDPLSRARGALVDAIERGEHDLIVATCLELVTLLLDGRHLLTALWVIEDVVHVLTAGGSSKLLWRVLLCQSAVYDGLGEIPNARRVALAAHDAAVHAGSSIGVSRANALIERLRRHSDHAA